MTRIGLISDVHATPEPVADALAIFSRAKVQHVLCAGDIAGYGDRLDETVALLKEGGCRSIRGNHEARYLQAVRESPESPVTRFLRRLPTCLDLVVAGRRLHMAHAHPPRACTGGMKLLDRQGRVQSDQKRLWAERLRGFDYDVLVVGHTHQVFAETLDGMLVVNPGSSAFNHTCAILSLPGLEVEFHALCGRQPVLSWNWGQYQAGRT